MPWRRSERLKPPTSIHPVPDPEAVRRAALAASWQRDRRIAQRRLAWRWVLWYVGRYCLRILGVLAALLLAAWLMRGALLSGSTDRAAKPVIESVAASHLPPAAQADQPLPAWPAPSLVPATVYADLPTSDLGVLSLRMVRQLGPQPDPDVLPVATHPIESAAPSAHLYLITESWLHSKEP